MLSVSELFFSIQIAICAYTISAILMQPGQILWWYYQLLEKIENRAQWIAKPLGMCEKCFAGQIALWYFVLSAPNYNASEIFRGVLFVCCAVFFTKVVVYILPD